VELGSDLALTDVTGTFSASGGIEGEFEARVNGEAEIAGLISRGRFGPNVQILSSDGGAVLRSAGIFRTAHGGRMQLSSNRSNRPELCRTLCASRARACATRPRWRSF
jgi:hypothetical protein